ncbi:MAG: hypothetical protein ACR2GY_06015, partial [Phycisphaerales bacterium]
RGCVIVLDMVAHDRHAYRNSMGHVHLGFSKESMHALAADAQLCVRSWRRLRLATEARGPGLFVAVLHRDH